MVFWHYLITIWITRKYNFTCHCFLEKYLAHKNNYFSKWNSPKPKCHKENRSKNITKSHFFFACGSQILQRIFLNMKGMKDH